MMAALQDALALINGESNLAAEHAEIGGVIFQKKNQFRKLCDLCELCG